MLQIRSYTNTNKANQTKIRHLTSETSDMTSKISSTHHFQTRESDSSVLDRTDEALSTLKLHGMETYFVLWTSPKSVSLDPGNSRLSIFSVGFQKMSIYFVDHLFIVPEPRLKFGGILLFIFHFRPFGM